MSEMKISAMTTTEVNNALETRQRIKEFFEAVGGPQGYITLKSMEPELAEKILKAYSLEPDEKD